MATLKEEQSKMHGEKLSEALKAEHVDAIPRDGTTHSHSHAAHLDGGEPDTKRRLPDLRRSPAPGALRQPPANVQRIGKQHRGQ